MRLMLGTVERPSLLINVKQEYSPIHFDFEVINGRWDGTYRNGFVTIWYPGCPWSNLDKIEILSDNQDRLRGDYQEVFNNFENPNYVAPKPTQAVFDDMDDDIPF